MKLLLTGANGMLGRDVMSQLGAVHQVLPFPKQALDIADASQVDRVVAREMPDVIINCAAYTDVDGCESQRQASLAVNALGPRNLALAAARHDAALLHVSTDYVFDGQAVVPYTEFDPVAPVTAYGIGKLAGEQAVRTHAPRHFILRSAWLYGAHGPNFVRTMLRLAAERDALTVVDDQVGNPTWTRELAGVIGRLIETEAYGTYHATAEGQVSWYGFCQEILRLMGVTTPVSPIGSDQFPRPAKRPAFSALENFCLKAQGIHMRPWDEALAEFLAEASPDPAEQAS